MAVGHQSEIKPVNCDYLEYMIFNVYLTKAPLSFRAFSQLSAEMSFTFKDNSAKLYCKYDSLKPQFELELCAKISTWAYMTQKVWEWQSRDSPVQYRLDLIKSRK